MTTNHPILTIEVPGRAVSVNAAYRRGKRHTRYTKAGRPYLSGGIYMSEEAKAWKETVRDYAYAAGILALASSGRATQKLRLPLRVVISVRGTYLDADNCLKLILDGLAEGIGVDDRQYRPITISATRAGYKEPRTVICVYEADSEEDRAA